MGRNQGDHQWLEVEKLWREILLKQVLSDLFKHERIGTVQGFSSKLFHSLVASCKKLLSK